MFCLYVVSQGLTFSLYLCLYFVPPVLFHSVLFSLERMSDESVRSHGSDIDDSCAAVYIRIGGDAGFCNGTLVSYRTKLFVWTTAHALVDTSESGLPLLPGIELLLARDAKQRPVHFQRLAWVCAHHSYGQFDWKAEKQGLKSSGLVPLYVEEKRGFDVLMFELHGTHSDLAEKARKVYQSGLGGEHDRVSCRSFKPSTLPNASSDQPVGGNVDGKIQSRESHVPLGHMEHQAQHGTSGAGLIDRMRQLQGVIAAYVDYSGAVRSIIILPHAFTELWKGVLSRASTVVTVDNASLADDLIAAAAL